MNAPRATTKPRLFWPRIGVVLIFIPAVVLTVLSRIWREIKPLPIYLRSDLCDDFDAARRIWRTGR